MAKDGTQRGGARVGAGRKSKALVDKINEGASASVLNFPETDDLIGVDVPPVKDFMKAHQKNGKDFLAEEIYKETFQWLKARGCEKAVYSELVVQYAMSVSRWIQCEEIVSEFGFLAKHPTTGNAIASPYVSMSQSYMKQVNQLWYQIFQIVRENCSSDFSGNPMDDTMEKLLTTGKGR